MKEIELGGMRINDLRRLLTEWRERKEGLVPYSDPVPLLSSHPVAPLPQIFRHNSNLAFYGDSDPDTYLVRFKTDMEVHQVPLPARCRLFAASLRGSAQKWFSKMGGLIYSFMGAAN